MSKITSDLPLVERADALRLQISQIMREVGVYSPIFDLIIDAVATNKAICDQMFEQISADGLTLMETSREGEPRYRTNPLVSARLEYEKSLRASLTELMMTAKSSNLMGGDELDELNKRISQLMTNDADLGERRTKGTKKRGRPKAQSPQD